MAEGRKLICSHCGYALEAWSDGNPFFLSDAGEPQFFYHPNESQLEEYIQQSEGRYLTGEARQDFMVKRVGNMNDLLCLDCGNTFRLDADRQPTVCPQERCKSKNGVDVWLLSGKTCPRCKTGTFRGMPCGIS